MSFPKARRFDISPPRRRVSKNAMEHRRSPPLESKNKPNVSNRTSTPEKRTRRTRNLNQTFSFDEENELYQTGLSEFFANLDDSLENPPEENAFRKLVDETESKLRKLYESTTLNILVQSKSKIEECINEISRANIRAVRQMERQSVDAIRTLNDKFELMKSKNEQLALQAMSKQIDEAQNFSRYLETEYIKLLDHSRLQISAQAKLIDSLSERINMLELSRAITERKISRR